ncbi:hypothetical protein [Paenibacillus sp. MMS18-CY102]|uniref:hypothetical protein n=1 Tax=Paenibacillus sp. MMS18-CY102 TaxID=2682849 RepID=UPI0013656B8B|nr:hypothetical protein [Paenibacillus sp. MMS18-CY102]MWC26919.1 hypothetical protein [Paenibacillus sp. MMS18-CY102]
MKFYHHFWLIVLSVVLSTFVSVFIAVALVILSIVTESMDVIGHLDFSGGILVNPFMLPLFMTTMFGVPASLIIFRLVRRNGSWWRLVRGMLHAFSGGVLAVALVALLGGGWDELSDGANLFLVGIGALQGIMYFLVYCALKRMMNGMLANGAERTDTHNLIDG